MTTRRTLARAAVSTTLALAAVAIVADTATAETTRRTYYVSCDGDDDETGKSSKRPWRTIDRANDAELNPGDRLLLERGCTWDGERLNVTWSGTPEAPITIANYGSGAKPLIQNGKNSNIKITGSYVNLRGLRVDYTNLPTVACDQPVENVYGFNVTGGAAHVTISYSEASGSTAGIHLGKASYGNVIRNNKIFDNDVLTTFGDDPSKDLGAWGVLVRSDDNQIIDNRLWGNEARCSNQGFKLMSNSVEIYEGDRNYIARNRATDRVFSELGSSSTNQADGNTYEFNVHDSDHDDARFITTRGAGKPFGPVNATIVTNNTVHLTGEGSQGIICGGICDATALSLHDNVIVAEEKSIFASGDADIGANLVWNSDGTPLVQIGPDKSRDLEAMPHLIAVDPAFVNADRGNFRLRAHSPAIGMGSDLAQSEIDVSKKAISGAFDLGAFDY